MSQQKVTLIQSEKILTRTRKPQPPIVHLSVLGTNRSSVYALSSAQIDLTHRSAQPCHLGESHALVAATINGLLSISSGHASRLMKAFRNAVVGKFSDQVLLRLAAGKLQVHLRTNNTRLIEAAQYLVSAKRSDDEVENRLRTQLRRFEIKWILLPSDAEELRALKRWAEHGSQEGQPIASLHEQVGCDRSVCIEDGPVPAGNSALDVDVAA